MSRLASFLLESTILSLVCSKFCHGRQLYALTADVVSATSNNPIYNMSLVYIDTEAKVAKTFFMFAQEWNFSPRAAGLIVQDSPVAKGPVLFWQHWMNGNLYAQVDMCLPTNIFLASERRIHYPQFETSLVSIWSSDEL